MNHSASPLEEILCPRRSQLLKYGDVLTKVSNSRVSYVPGCCAKEVQSKEKARERSHRASPGGDAAAGETVPGVRAGFIHGGADTSSLGS